jgi:outer membrane protein OmpA-like peptidoglycan-associated protein
MLVLSQALPLSAQLEAGGSASAQEGTAQDAPRGDGSTTLTDPGADDNALEHWWLGAYYRHLWMPSYMTDPFFARAPSVTNDGFGLEATYRTGGGFNIVMGIGYMPYEFHGPFLAKNNPITDTEYVDSNLAFWHLTSSLLWDIEFHRTVALELGLGLDIGVLSGDLNRNEAYIDGDRFRKCKAPLMPLDVDKTGQLFCQVPENGSYNPLTRTFRSDAPADKGEHYNVNDDRVPPVMLFPMIPHIALRVQPFKYLAIKAEFGFGVVQIWAGVSLHGSFGIFAKGPKEIFVSPDEVAVTGRVLGRVVEDDTGTPVAGATVKLTARALSGLTTETDGRFIVDRLDPGPVRFDVSHPDYAPTRCDGQIPKRGGDVAVECHLTARARVGAISGQVQAEDGSPVPSPSIELSGTRNDKLKGDAQGLFAAVDLPAGTYRLRVEADDYLVQVVELQVVAHETAMPQIILTKKPKHSLVELRREEIVITEQVQFKSSSAVILPASEDLLRQVADVFLRHTQIEKVEVQGHTDSKGGRLMNMELSQKRAESVRAWLIEAGVQAERLDARGYGPDHPLRPNDTPANRAQNRRVQFIIRAQSSTVEEQH